MNRLVGAALLATSLATSTQAFADPIRILVAASHARGAPGELPLQHATEDARHVSDVLTSLGGFRPEDAIVLADPSLVGLDAALERARALAATHARDEVTFVFYFSGHGDRDRIHLGAETLTVVDLASRVRAVPAVLRVLVTDACRNYPTRMKGITTEPGFAIAPAPTNSASGVIWLFASGEGEPAQESDELQGALFTHYWVSALRGAGDTNGDGRVTLAESYDFAFNQTLLRSARGNGVLQHPAAVFDLRAAAPLVLTSTVDGATSLRFPRSSDTQYLVYALGARAVMGEIWSSPDHDATLALPPGRYIVERRAPQGAAGLEIALGRGEVRALSPAEFHAVPEEELARKGGGAVLRPDEVAIDLTMGASHLMGLGELGTIRYAHAFDAWAIGAGVAFGIGTTHGSAENVALRQVGIDATLEHRWRTASWTLSLGAGGGGDVVWQSLVRTDAARAAALGYPTAQRYRALGFGPIGEARLRYALSPALWAELTARAGVSFFDLDASPSAVWNARGGLGVGTSF